MPRKIYTREFSVHKGNALVLDDTNNTRCFALAFPPEFNITRVILQQVGGTNRGGNFALYDASPCPEVTGEDGSSESLGAVPNPDLHRVIPIQTFSAGNAAELFAASEGGPGWQFANREGTFTVPVKKIYLEIETTSGGTDEATFDFVISGEPAVGL
jgi:hypothetical protein